MSIHQATSNNSIGESAVSPPKVVKKRKVDLLIISDVHLGTYGCHAKELLQYMKSIKPKMVVLNGDIIDMWQFSKRYWPKSHTKVINHIIKWITKDVKVYYVTGNHDEMLRKYVGFKIGSLRIVNKMVIDLNGKSTWIFHGDVFDVTMKHSKWLTRLGSYGYDLLILLNAFSNWVLTKFGSEKICFSKKIKNSVKKATSFINNFEQTCADIASSAGYSNVVCGHIHHPEIKTITTAKGDVQYLNTGDWIENLSALEYHKGCWRIYKYDKNDFDLAEAPDESEQKVDMNYKELFSMMLKEFSIEGSNNSNRKTEIIKI